MQEPKRRKSRSRTRSRRAHWKTTVPSLVRCDNRACRELKLAHRACPRCGQYRGRWVTA
ncbi:50S ribosomal protein L32 [Actinopolymorpha pittospori]|uniref:50S ribosomal protein L32 n=1 Tax=Actinopolymorpha pittospori TaxID=648752 RepID=UPI00178A3008|nr:50S ribosomal protein L32 [Actinopolymorpha pittospori]